MLLIIYTVSTTCDHQRWDLLSHRYGQVGVELNPFLKTALNVFCMHKNDFFSRILFSLSNLIHLSYSDKAGLKDPDF